MASLYRRKQDAILGLDNASFTGPSDTLANAVARYRDDAVNVGNTNTVEDNALARIEGSRDYARSLYDHNTNIDDDYEVSEMEDSDDDFIRGRRLLSRMSRGNRHDSPWKSQEGNSGISSKAQRLLGMTKSPENPLPEPPQQLDRRATIKSISSDTESIAPKALRTLGLSSNRSTRLTTAHPGMHEADELKRAFQAQSRSPFMGNRNSDVSSSISRESTISWRTETPRSSQEVHIEDLRWKHRPSVFSQRSDSLVDPKAVLTEPFSPMSTNNPFEKALHGDSDEFTFELPAEVPMAHWAPDKTEFVAELPSGFDGEPIFEMPAMVPEAVELAGSPISSPSIQHHVELPAEVVGPTKDVKHTTLGILHPDIAELNNGSQEKDTITKVAGKSSPSTTYRTHQRVVSSPTRAVSVPRQFSGKSPTSTDVASVIARRPTVVGIQTQGVDSMSRVRSDEAFKLSRPGGMLSKSASAEFASSSTRMVIPTSPTSGASLGRIAAMAASHKPRSGSISMDTPANAVKSKFNTSSQNAPQVITPPVSRLSTEQLYDIYANEDEEDETPKAVEESEKQVVSESIPESPITGWPCGPPNFNKPLPQPLVEPAAAKTKEDVSRLRTPSKVKEKQAVSSPVVSNLIKQGLL